MSKAFFKEDTVPDEGPTLAPRPSEPLPLTPAGRERLVAERASIDPKDEAKVTRRLTLERILATTFVREPALHEGGAGFGCDIVVEDPRGVRRTYTLVGPDEVDPAHGLISEASPLGEILLGRKVGDVVELERGEDVIELVVREVRVA
ncbi:MAG: GreA/GreB family elongation factor [Deltaproteobacteria bacterium]|nr:GreA/GreB family elongation factor [Deltaproteobacteria bacterium]